MPQQKTLFGIAPGTIKKLEEEAPHFDVRRKQTAKALRAIKKDRIANASYSRLLSSGLNRFPGFLEQAAGAAVSLRRRTPKRPNWLSGLGMTPKQLDYFPKRLRDLAGDLERFNNHPLFRPDTWVPTRKVSEPMKKLFEQRFAELPFLLRAYAASLSGYGDLLRSIPGQRLMRPRTAMLLALMQSTRLLTGKPMYPDLSNVLLAAADETETTVEGLDPDSLKSLDAAYQRQIAKRTER